MTNEQLREETVHLGRTDADPAEVGYDAGKLDVLDRHFLKLIAERKLQAASYLLARYGSIFAHKSMGARVGFEEGGDLKPDSIRRIASTTKAFTAVAIMKLVEDGKLYLEQPVSSVIGEFDTALHKSITVFHLLTHTSGICPDPGYYLEPYPRGWWNGTDSDDWIKGVLSGPVRCKPGEFYNYSSAGFGVLGELIGRVTGMHYNDYVARSILEPLEMERTFFEVPPHLHGEVCLAERFDAERLTANTKQPGKMPRAGGGLHSTLHDLWKFGQMLLDKGTFRGKRIIGRKSVEAMTRNHLFRVPAYAWGVQIPSKNYGLGLNLFLERGELKSQATFSHEGAGRCALHIDPAEQLVAVFFVPTSLPGFLPESIVHPGNIIWSGLN
ncbi:serine hydrolase domain-containing protein [Paenibacillus sp. GYB003]|uniref:serine hydrolase domain-containing protein n=1 Tax=Paenibacillus sp. GYB003 TaxID=2994392 RepID=UPI002F96DE72